MKLPNWIRKQEFNPDFLGLFINPFFFVRRALYQIVSEWVPQVRGNLLDVGCGRKPYRDLFPHVEEYIGMDTDLSGHSHENENIDVYYNGKDFPFDNETFSAILCNQVTEHVFEPDTFIAEIHRVLKPNGMLLLTIPFIWAEHEKPFDYARYTSFGLAHLLQKHGFTIIEQSKTLTDTRTIFQIWNMYWHKVTEKLRPNRLCELIVTLLIFTPVNITGILLYKFLPKNNDLYMDLAVLAKKD